MLKHIFSYFDKSSTFISGVLAIGIYLVLLLTVLFYFNTRQAIKPVHYVKKNEDKIRISIASVSTKEKLKSSNKQAKIPKVAPPKIVKPKPKKKETVKKEKDTNKKVIKEKVVKNKLKKKEKEKPKPTPKPKPKKVNKPKSLFENIKTSKPKEKVKKKENSKPIIKTSKPRDKPKKKSASQMLSDSMKVQKQSDRGKEKAYFALIEEKLKGWPAQSEYAGETVEIRITIASTGKFTFKILRHSSNTGFNNSLKSYLKQLQGIGLGKHKGNRPYVIDVEFEAKE